MPDLPADIPRALVSVTQTMRTKLRFACALVGAGIANAGATSTACRTVHSRRRTLHATPVNADSSRIPIELVTVRVTGTGAEPVNARIAAAVRVFKAGRFHRTAEAIAKRRTNVTVAGSDALIGRAALRIAVTAETHVTSARPSAFRRRGYVVAFVAAVNDPPSSRARGAGDSGHARISA